MKTRLTLLVFAFLAWAIICNLFLSPVTVLVRNAAAVSSVSNSNTAFVAQRAIESGYDLSSSLLGYLVIIAILFSGPLYRLIFPATK